MRRRNALDFLAGLEGGKFLGVLGEAKGLDGADALLEVGGGEIQEVEDSFHCATQGVGVFDGGEFAGDEAQGFAGG